MSINIPEYLSSAPAPRAAASGCDGSSACESGVFQTCDGVVGCQGCQQNGQCAGRCQMPCEVGCQTSCQTTCQNCQGVSCQTCQSACELSCQNCQGVSCQTCQSTCEKSCQNCQGVSCQTCQGCMGCMGCMDTCQYSCQSTCQLSCQNCQGASCQTCQTACESQVQTTDYYSWSFNPVSAGGNSSDSAVRGLWSGFVEGREVLCSACNGFLWELFLDSETGQWSKTACGELNTSLDVHMFGFDEKLYILNGSQYRVWDGTTLSDVEGYRPLVSVSNEPGGGGNGLEQVNKLNGTRRARFSPDGTATLFRLPETGLKSIDYVKKTSDGAEISFTADTEAGTLTITPAPPSGTNSIEIGWTVLNDASQSVRAMRYAEIFNGAQDSRVFIYGDGSNEAFYSGLDYNGRPTAEYFPDLNEMAIGDANTPLTALIRQYGQMLAFKLDSAYSVYYDTITLADGTVTAGFKVTPVNRDIGNCAMGQARLVENKPRTLDGRSAVEWSAGTSSMGSDQRNAKRISQRVDRTIREFKLEDAKTFYDKLSHEFYIIGEDGTALVNSIDADAWYIYTDFAATCLIRYQDELYFGTNDGSLCHLSDGYFSDNGKEIDCWWESGSMSFGKDFKRKYSAMIWIGIKPENNGYLKVTAETDVKSDFAEYSFSTDSAEAVPTMNRIKLKAKKFTFYKLVLSNCTAYKTATVVSADIRIRGTGYVR